MFRKPYREANRPASCGGRSFTAFQETRTVQMMLWGLQSPINIGMILRTAEVYHVGVGIFDSHGVLQDRAAMATIEDFACGAWQRRPPAIFSDPAEARRFAAGRTVATAITPDATPIQDFGFAAGDCIYVGNEYDGLPEEVLSGSDVRITIPMPTDHLPKPMSHSPIDPMRGHGTRNDGIANLNVAVAASIIMFVSLTRPSQATRAEPARPPHAGSR